MDDFSQYTRIKTLHDFYPFYKAKTVLKVKKRRLNLPGSELEDECYLYLIKFLTPEKVYGKKECFLSTTILPNCKFDAVYYTSQIFLDSYEIYVRPVTQQEKSMLLERVERPLLAEEFLGACRRRENFP
jgi:hypothetical protein